MLKTGIVEDIRYTCGGAGNQWTTISGVRYATWWDVRTMDWKVGDAVTFIEYQATLWSGQPQVVLGAHSIHKLTGSKACKLLAKT